MKYIVTKIYIIEADSEEEAKKLTYYSVPDDVIVEEKTGE
jgi:hypothetical protein